ncbi:hypothetical protein P0O24_11195 [Methanotrichaceae archaeon M04Ac]|uniref:Uncharacterized protein n=1 Tax=Candidatus Methanocrinis alkalitolerans TaxID=3033395 RepID=A0ABT5XHI1_9EURY|nr:hypothetical protein [Candidatus Methanocrinis alkalitolerans]MCR3884184.1 hypothetical protein [Methanothrix sp.]MDF0594146.1 hypothetical protein [Candidatus Methanocrinis alkalitolerans]
MSFMVRTTARRDRPEIMKGDRSGLEDLTATGLIAVEVFSAGCRSPIERGELAWPPSLERH